MMDADRIKKRADDLFEQVRAIRRHIHMHPELSFHETATSAYIENILREAGISYSKVAGTGILAEIVGNGPGHVVGIRADIDALPIQEANNRDYRSTCDGVMHACGHDAHTACVIGAMRIMHESRSEWPGRLKVLFQPGEEKLPGGATLMIKDGVLDNPKLDVLIAQHVFPDLETGKVGFRSGKYMASADEIYLTIKGKGGHAALPHKLVDPVLMTAHILVALQQIVSRNMRPDIPAVLSFGAVHANGATNVIPDEVSVAGTFRTMDEPYRMQMHHRICETAEFLAKSMGGECVVDIQKGYPVLINDEYWTETMRAAAEKMISPHHVVSLDLRMTSEDFAYYSHHVPTVFYRLGTRNESKGIVHGLHTSQFDIDEDALKVGTAMMAWLAYSALSSPSRS